MNNKELMDILCNIPQEVFKNNNEKLHSVIRSEIPTLCLFTSKGFSAVELTLYQSMQYRIWYDSPYKDVTNQIESYLNILGFTKKHSTIFANDPVISDKDFYKITKEQLIDGLIKSI